MTKVLTEPTVDSSQLSEEAQRVLQWRYDRLRNAGYTTKAANVIALRNDIELHRANDLLHTCGDQEQALKILL